MKHRTILPRHRFSREQMKDLLESIDSNVEIVLTFAGNGPPNQFDALERRFPNLKIESGRNNSSKLDASKHKDVDVGEIIEDILNDPSTALIWERSVKSARSSIKRLFTGKQESFLKASASMPSHVLESIELFRELKVTFLVFASTPHTITAWIHAKTALALGIKVFVIERAAVQGFWKITPGLSLNRESLILESQNRALIELYQTQQHRLITRLRKSYSEAIPDYEKKRIERNRGKVFSLWNTAKKNWYAPTRTLNALRCWRTLQDLSIKDFSLLRGRYAVFFLHYQPERTTVPDGGVFGSQLNAVVLLRRALRSDIQLFVREHPSTFSNNCDPFARDPDYYRCVQRLEGVSWISNSVDTFELLDGAGLVATITGTVALEAVARGVPAVCFGRPILQGAKWMHQYNNEESLQRFTEGAFSDDFSKRRCADSIEEALDSEISKTYCADSSSEEDKKIEAIKQLVMHGVLAG